MDNLILGIKILVSNIWIINTSKILNVSEATPFLYCAQSIKIFIFYPDTFQSPGSPTAKINCRNWKLWFSCRRDITLHFTRNCWHVTELTSYWSRRRKKKKKNTEFISLFLLPSLCLCYIVSLLLNYSRSSWYSFWN